MFYLLLFSGLFLVGAVLVDALRTAVSVGGGGPLTTRLARGLWQAAFVWHRRRNEYPPRGPRLLAKMGTVVLLSIIGSWIFLLWGGYLLIFSAEPSAVVNASTGAPASFWERVYFSGFTVSTLGTGDFVPSGQAWRVVTALASLNGLFLVTLSITYLLPVLQAVVAKRQLAAAIANLGHTPQEILEGGWDGESLGSLEQPLAQLIPMVELHGQRHLVYPALHFFCSSKPRAAVGPRVAALSEAIRLIDHLPAEARPPRAVVRSLRHAIDGYLGTLSAAFLSHPEQSEDPPRPEKGPLRALREQGLPLGDDAGTPPTGEDLEEGRRRRLLHELVLDDGRTWSDAVGPRDEATKKEFQG